MNDRVMTIEQKVKNDRRQGESLEPNDEERTRRRKHLCSVLFVVTALLLAAAACLFLWEREIQKPIHRTLHHKAEIRTEDYWLELPIDWTKKADAKIGPMHEKYGGRDSDGQKRIPEENYQLIVFMKREDDKEHVQLASLEMYSYLEDCQQMDDWELIGKLSVTTQGIPYATAKHFSSFLILHYGKAPENLSLEEKEQFAAMQTELAASVKDINVQKPQELSERKKKENEEALVVRFEPNRTGNKKPGQTWEEKYQEEEAFNRQMEELQRQQKEEKKKRKEKEATEAEKKRKQYEAWVKSQRQKKRSAKTSSSGHKDDYYKDDFDSFWEDNAEDYDNEEDAYEDWEEEYGEE